MSDNIDQKTVYGFGILLDQRFTMSPIKNMMKASSLDNIVYSDQIYWLALE